MGFCVVLYVRLHALDCELCVLNLLSLVTEEDDVYEPRPEWAKAVTGT